MMMNVMPFDISKITNFSDICANTKIIFTIVWSVTVC